MVVDDDATTQQDFEAALLESLRPLVTTGQVRAVGWCLDVLTRLPRSNAPTDAIVIVMEHRAGEALHCFIPYHRNWRGVLQYGEPFSALPPHGYLEPRRGARPNPSFQRTRFARR
jgi:hypothetical protein